MHSLSSSRRTLGLASVLILVGTGLSAACSPSEGTPSPTPGEDASVVEAGPKGCAAQEPQSCKQGEACTKDEACVTGSCAKGVCAPASCTDGKQTGDEKGLDCGGSCRACNGDACKVNAECKSNLCFRGACIDPATLPCGETKAAKCEVGEPCLSELDCASDVCIARLCEPVTDARHSDGRRNAGEVGIDCGGSIAATKPCAAGQACLSSVDCDGVCDMATKKCLAPSHTDGKKNLGETDIDCGGTTPDGMGAFAPKCRSTKSCGGGTDCESGFCVGSVCDPRRAGRKDGDETDVDCGGTADPDTGIVPARCGDDKSCGGAGDCASGMCNNIVKKCVGAKSCLSAGPGFTEGVMTCGEKEAVDATKKHESCCRSLPLPTRGKRLDKYEITSGRVRAFINDVGPNIRAWVASYAAARPGSQLANLVSLSPVVGNLYPAVERGGALNLVAHLGIDIDNYNGIRGCYNGAATYGANAYWQDATRLADYGMPPRSTSRAELDQKSQNCLMPIMFAAFCAWDGGELAQLADYRDAWGAAAYPWGANNIGRPNYNWCNGTMGNGGWTCQDTALGNMGVFYEWPVGQDRARGLEVWFAAPGRFTMDRSANLGNGEPWMDLYGNMAEYTGDFAGTGNDFCDFSTAPAGGATTCTRSNKPVGSVGTRYTGIPTAGIIGVSWEGHNYGRGTTSGFPATFQYGKFGGRCVRPL